MEIKGKRILECYRISMLKIQHMFVHNISELFYIKTLSTECVDDMELLSAFCEPACSLAVSKTVKGCHWSFHNKSVPSFTPFKDDFKSKCFTVDFKALYLPVYFKKLTELMLKMSVLGRENKLQLFIIQADFVKKKNSFLRKENIHFTLIINT